ncbi:MAG: hypothetical protein KDD75_24290, partial [Caldilineaceae bacterium]|nr:hypothetical protein [Caldilineaceae bacterium]
TNWTPSYVIGPGTATRIHNGPWAAGAWFTDTVIFAAAPDIQLSGTYTNIIEIESATNGANLDDVDSDPDSNATNELFIKDNFVRDNFRLNPQIFDEDDHDIAQVQLTIEDWGDNPDAGAGRGVGDYGTLLTDNGPRHTVIAGLHMGALVDGESDGQPTADATGDNNAGLDDEDGVNRTDLVLVEGMNATIRVTATNTTTAPATLYGFVDFNANGVFTDTGEAVSVVVPTNSEDRVVTLDFGIVPTNGITETFARFRLSTDANLTAQGPAGDGEVEDYLVTFGIPPADIALRKSRTSAAVAAPGDDVTFAIEVINQGVVTVSRALVVDYIPSGFTLSANDANGWVGGPGGTVTNTLATTLTPSGTVDAQTTVNIILTADAAAAGIYTNTAEIAAIFDENDQALTDIDSTPDAINGNGNGETTALEDDQIDENGTVSGQDEDDHDPATVRVEPDAVGTLIVRKVVSGTLITNCAAITGADTDDSNPLNDNVDGCAALTQLSAAAAGQHFTFTNDITTTAGLITPTFVLQPGEEIRFENVIVGSYTITESLPNGWTLAAATCSDGSSTVAGDTLAGIAVTNGATITCVFTNTLSTAQFGDRVFLETDGDGLANSGDITPITGMVITATASDNTVYTTTTDVDGYYS